MAWRGINAFGGGGGSKELILSLRDSFIRSSPEPPSLCARRWALAAEGPALHECKSPFGREPPKAQTATSFLGSSPRKARPSLDPAHGGRQLVPGQLACVQSLHLEWGLGNGEAGETYTDSQRLQRYEFVLLSMAKVGWFPSALQPLG